MSDAATSVSIVTQTVRAAGERRGVRPLAGRDQHGDRRRFPGFIEQRLMPPKPPLQVDWVILQRFASLEDAKRWLGSSERQSRIEGVAPMLVGRDDVHIVRDDASAAQPAPVSAVISTRVKPGKEAEYLQMGAQDRRGAVEGARAAGLSLRTVGAGRAGGLRRHLALRQRDQPAGLARVRPSAGSCSRRPPR